MFPKPKSVLVPNTYAYESEPMVKATGFREYDARWLFGKEINLMGIQALGMGLGALIAELGVRQEVVTGHDFRGYSASIKYALISGLMAAGCKVHDIGLCMTPMAYFAQYNESFVREQEQATMRQKIFFLKRFDSELLYVQGPILK